MRRMPTFHYDEWIEESKTNKIRIKPKHQDPSIITSPILENGVLIPSLPTSHETWYQVDRRTNQVVNASKDPSSKYAPPLIVISRFDYQLEIYIQKGGHGKTANSSSRKATGDRSRAAFHKLHPTFRTTHLITLLLSSSRLGPLVLATPHIPRPAARRPGAAAFHHHPSVLRAPFLPLPPLQLLRMCPHDSPPHEASLTRGFV